MATSKANRTHAPLDGVDFGFLNKPISAETVTEKSSPAASETEEERITPEAVPLSSDVEKEAKRVAHTASGKAAKEKNRPSAGVKKRVVLMLPVDIAGAIEIQAKRQRSMDHKSTRTHNPSTVAAELVSGHLASCIEQYYEELEITSKYM